VKFLSKLYTASALYIRPLINFFQRCLRKLINLFQHILTVCIKQCRRFGSKVKRIWSHNRGEVVSLIIGAILIITSFICFVWLNGKLPFVQTHASDANPFARLQKRDINLRANIQCPFPVAAHLRAIVLPDDSIAITFQFYALDDTGKDSRDAFLKKKDKCESIQLSVSTQGGTVTPEYYDTDSGLVPMEKLKEMAKVRDGGHEAVVTFILHELAAYRPKDLHFALTNLIV
jgi:hypothetical protein